MKPAAVLIGLDSTTGLQSARILAARGVRVIGIATDVRHPCCRTRACERIYGAPPHGPGLVRALKTVAQELGERAVLLPCTDLAVATVSQRQDELAGAFRMVMPAWAVLELLLDKARFAEWALRQALPIPRTRVLRSRADLEAACAELRFPCVLKPAVKTERWKRQTRIKLYDLPDARTLRTRYEACAGLVDELVVQEVIAGPDGNSFTCNCYFDRTGQPVVAFTSRKLRQWPPVGGEACLSEEIDDAQTRELALRLFACAGHRGLGYLEVKVDARTGERLIIEANVGRPTGRSAQAEAAGVELLYTMYCDAAELALPPAQRQPHTGMKWIYLRRDIQAALHQWRRGELTLSEWRRSWRGVKVEALFSWREPLPFWGDFARVLTKGVKARRNARLPQGVSAQ